MIYNLVQSAREFYKNVIDVLKIIQCIGSKSNPCLLSKLDLNADNICIIGIYVEECLVLGKEVSTSSTQRLKTRE
jgi:hypothetical protein